MKKLLSVALLGAFLAATNIGCSDSKPAAKPAETPKGGSDKPGGDGGRAPSPKG